MPTPTLAAGKPPTLAQLLDEARAACEERNRLRELAKQPASSPAAFESREELDLSHACWQARILEDIVRHLDADAPSDENVAHTTNQED